MRNEAMFPPSHEEFNEFTRRLRRKCKLLNTAVVQLRNSGIARVSCVKTEDGYTFMEGDYDRLWHPSGKSLTSSDFDIIGM